MTDEEMKQFIDTASYEQLLHMNRFEPLGSEWFMGGIGLYLHDRMMALKKTMSPQEQVDASKNVGW